MLKTETSVDDFWARTAYDRHDLTNCASEPIEYCGAIQAGGYLLTCDHQGAVQVASENCAEIFGVAKAEELLGLQLMDLIRPDGPTRLTLEQAEEKSTAGGLKVRIGPKHQLFMATFHGSDQGSCVDIEPMMSLHDDYSSRYVHELRKLVHQVDSEIEMDAILDRAAGQVRKLTGFDRVMIYRFEPNWDGVVIAESRAQNLDPFLGLHYPESDIPQQARRLYMDQRYRMIISVDRLPVPVVTRKGLGRSEVDLSCSSLRGVSPIHIQYLRNMGVQASFSVPIRVHGRLWGLIACHHYASAVHLPREVRSSCELAAQVISGRVGDYNNDRRLRLRNRVNDFAQNLLSAVSEGSAAVQAFANEGAELLDLTRATGAFVRLGGGEILIGDTPPPESLRAILEHLAPMTGVSLWSTRNLRTDLPAIEFDSRAVGALAVPLSLGFEDLFIWFRPEAVEEVRWGGKPAPKEANLTLEPRASFAAWTETIRDRSRSWGEPDLEAAQHLLFTFVRGIFKKAAELSKANTELESVTRAKDEFIGMVSHELRTPLGVMIGWIDILRDEGLNDPKQRQAVDIIERNARLQINLINDLLDISRIISGKMRLNMEGNVDLTPIVREVITGLTPTAQIKNIVIECLFDEPTPMAADPERLRQIVWNLISNAIKFTPKNGHISARIRREASAYLIEIADSGIGIAEDQLGRIFSRFSQAQDGHAKMGGLGLGLSIVKALVELHGGRIEAFSPGAGRGSTFAITLPISALRTEQIPAVGSVERVAQQLADLRIMVAEDQPEAALALKHTLEKMGATVTTMSNGRDAFEVMKRESFDLLLSDIGMPDGDGYELIRRWRTLERERGAAPLAALALTAYATSKDRTRCLEAGFQNHVPKPVDRHELLAVIHSLGLRSATDASQDR